MPPIFCLTLQLLRDRGMHRLIIGIFFSTVVALAGCGGGGSGGGGVAVVPTTTPNTGGANDPTLPQSVSVGGQNIWETQGGLPLYTFNGDTAGVSNCTGSCAAIWPPQMAGASSTAVGSFTIVTRTNPAGSQWAYSGAPLYTFVSDKAGQPPTGNGVQGFSIALVAGQTGAPSPPPGCKGPYC